ncbi:hypothetical protein D3C79_941450 [compost metagenome]
MPPVLRLSIPHRAKAYARAREPVAVISQERIEIAPTSASFVGSSTMPEPNMLTAVNIVSCPTLIFFATDIPLPHLVGD